MTEPLKPCPFCGNPQIEILPQEKGWMMVRCWECGANIKEVTSLESQMVACWNQRAPVPPKKRVKRRLPSEKEVADYYNETFIHIKRAEWVKQVQEYNEQFPDHKLEESDVTYQLVEPHDLTIGKSWECGRSPTKYCVYDYDNAGESCIFCGDPEERK